MSILRRHKNFNKDYSKHAKAYEPPGNAVHKAGPIDEKTFALIKVAVSTNARLERALHSHITKAFKASGASDEIKHAVILSLTTIGLPSVMAALRRADDIFKEYS